MKILVTGAAGGIGGAVCRLFLENGHEVTGFDVRDADLSHPDYTHFRLDIRDDDALPEIGEVNVLINCAGTQNGDDINVNLKALIHVTEKYAFRDGIRSVLHVGSASGHTGSEFPEYCASKGGVIAYTKNAALRLAEYGAVCNSLDPGGVLTRLNAPVTEDPELWALVMNETPLRRWATPEEIAEWAYFLTVNNGFCTGQSIVVDGGESIKRNFIWPGL